MTTLTSRSRPPASPVAVPRSALSARSARELLQLSRQGLDEASQGRMVRTPAERYATAHVAALRAAAAIIAVRAHPTRPGQGTGGSRRRPTSAWRLLAVLAPEFSEWAEFFSVTARKRAAAEAGIPGSVTVREADDLVRDAELFLRAVSTSIGFGSSGSHRSAATRQRHEQ